ncbi:MAG: glycosyltransferase [Acidobacteria bacterium]|nr:glycosyltransferase [Acidobacteriota bacterium]
MSLPADLLVNALLAAYACVLVVLAVFGLHRLYLVLLLVLRRRCTKTVVVSPTEWPTVTVQLPIFNELYVVEQLIDAVGALDYPADRLEIQVLDDSTDRTAAAAATAVARLRARGIDAVHMHRKRRDGFKAGALRRGLRSARGEFVAVFDADFAPAPDFLRRVIPHFQSEGVGMVQARWSHRNREANLLTRLQAVLLDAHFTIEHTARQRAGRFFNFNGTAGVWRRQAIDDAGGWHHDTLTEDLDLSYRAQLAGWQFIYLDDVQAPAELPLTISAFKAQQRRWTRGAAQTARKLLPRIWRSASPIAVKIEASFHLLSNLAYGMMVGLAILVSPVLALRARGIGGALIWLEIPVLIFGTGSVCLYFVAGQRRLGRPLIGAVAQLPLLMALGAGLALNNTIATVRGFAGATGEFVRTPKTSQVPAAMSGYRAGLGWVPWLEATLALYFVGVLVVVVQRGLWSGLPVTLLFLAGYSYIAGQAFREKLGSWRKEPVPALEGS